jgi:hypothetical protein
MNEKASLIESNPLEFREKLLGMRRKGGILYHSYYFLLLRVPRILSPFLSSIHSFSSHKTAPRAQFSLFFFFTRLVFPPSPSLTFYTGRHNSIDGGGDTAAEASRKQKNRHNSDPPVSYLFYILFLCFVHCFLFFCLLCLFLT